MRGHFELADAVAAFLEQPRVRPDDAYPQVNRLVANLQPPFPVPQALRQLAAIRDFDLFISTTPDDLMAAALDEVRFRGNAGTRRLAFSLKQSTTAQAQATDEPAQGTPVVFNLFGRFCTRPEYALHEEDSLEFIHGLVSRDVTPPDWLMSRVRDHDLLLLGVHLPDWLERFVLRTANRERLRKAGRAYYVARELEPSAAALALFFQRFGGDSRLNVYRGTAIEFVGELHRRWLERHPAPVAGAAETPGEAAAPRNGSIFISYDWQNLAAVERLHAALAELSDGDVWFDRRRLQPGSAWESEIASQIRHGVKLFVAVLSDLTERKPGNEGVVFAEWRAALERARGVITPRTFILPVVVDADATRGEPGTLPDADACLPRARALHARPRAGGRAQRRSPRRGARAAQADPLRHAMSTASAIDRDSPWPGLASYDESAHAFFSGRSVETAELARRIADEPLTVLFGKSGLGKSSLLRAGVFPVLRTRGLLPVLVRLYHDNDAPAPMEQVAAAMFAAFTAEKIEHPPRRDGETLWEYLHRDGLKFWTPKVRPVRPVIVLDQFEEVFTVGRAAREHVTVLREELADLAENRIPAAIAARYDAAEAPVGLDVHARPYKLVISLREDFLPDLEDWLATMPSLRRNRMRLLPMRRAQALEAVHNEYTAHLVDAPLAQRIVDYLAAGTSSPGTANVEDADDAGATVEPALLSLVCRGINEARRRAEKARFDDALFESGKGRIVADFYRESVADQPPRVRRFIEDELITEQGFRNSYAVVAAVERGSMTRSELATLVDRRLLRVEHHLGAERIELTHDLLTRPVLEGRVERVAAERAAARRRSVLQYGTVALVVLAVAAAFGLQKIHAVNAELDAKAKIEKQNAMLLENEAALQEALEAAERSASAAELLNRELEGRHRSACRVDGQRRDPARPRRIRKTARAFARARGQCDRPGAQRRVPGPAARARGDARGGHARSALRAVAGHPLHLAQRHTRREGARRPADDPGDGSEWNEARGRRRGQARQPVDRRQRGTASTLAARSGPRRHCDRLRCRFARNLRRQRRSCRADRCRDR